MSQTIISTLSKLIIYYGILKVAHRTLICLLVSLHNFTQLRTLSRTTRVNHAVTIYKNLVNIFAYC